MEDVELTDSGALVVSVRPAAGERDRCPNCRRRCPGYDLGEGRQRWRALGFGTTLAYLEADAPRVNCGHHGVIVAAAPWARDRRSHEHEPKHVKSPAPAPTPPRGAANANIRKGSSGEILRIARPTHRPPLGSAWLP